MSDCCADAPFPIDQPRPNPALVAFRAVRQVAGEAVRRVQANTFFQKACSRRRLPETI
jgi:hypothetical protein